MHEVFQKRDHIPVWHDAVRANEPDWKAFYRDYVATLDWPSASFWHSLSLAFPDALVLLSVRDSGRWFSSVDATINELMMRRPDADTRAWYAMADDLLRTTFVPFPTDRRAAIEAYNRHNDAVRSVIPPDRLLVWEPGDGWEPICSRLGCAVPDEPFPHLNTTDEYRELLDRLPRRRWRMRFRR